MSRFNGSLYNFDPSMFEILNQEREYLKKLNDYPELVDLDPLSSCNQDKYPHLDSTQLSMLI